VSQGGPGAGAGFGLDHLPYGVYSVGAGAPRVGVRYGDRVLDVATLRPELDRPTLNDFMALGPDVWAETRAGIVELAAADGLAATPLDDVSLHQPFGVGDYVDLYASLDHASNVGRIFRPDQEPLLPNWRHLPVGYHGRGGTVVVSGTPVIRPCGQRLTTSGGGEPRPEYGPSRRLDIEAELGFVVGVASELGSRIGVDELARHVFGVVGLNDWSARDIQAWEYVPLGPFLGKSFGTSVSAWVTPLAALDAAWCDLPPQDPAPLDYLRGGRGLDIDVEVVLDGTVVSRPPYRTMYWSAAQMLAHLTVNGASTRPGDLFASGTISGPEPDTRGSFLELSWGGKEPFAGPGGAERTFLEDGDEVTLRYSAPGAGGGRITLGEVTGRIEPARP
jgi:fumarylacetoacetase